MIFMADTTISKFVAFSHLLAQMFIELVTTFDIIFINRLHLLFSLPLNNILLKFQP